MSQHKNKLENKTMWVVILLAITMVDITKTHGSC